MTYTRQIWDRISETCVYSTEYEYGEVLDKRIKLSLRTYVESYMDLSVIMDILTLIDESVGIHSGAYTHLLGVPNKVSNHFYDMAFKKVTSRN